MNIVIMNSLFTLNFVIEDKLRSCRHHISLHTNTSQQNKHCNGVEEEMVPIVCKDQVVCSSSSYLCFMTIFDLCVIQFIFSLDDSVL